MTKKNHERHDQVRQMISAGASLSQCAKSLGISRGAVAGVIRRGGMTRYSSWELGASPELRRQPSLPVLKFMSGANARS